MISLASLFPFESSAIIILNQNMLLYPLVDPFSNNQTLFVFHKYQNDLPLERYDILLASSMSCLNILTFVELILILAADPLVGPVGLL